MKYKWYFISWKGDEAKLGGITSNIGIHFYDMLTWIFREVEENVVHLKTPDSFKLKNANVRWFLSVNYNYIPEEIRAEGQRTYRSITVDGHEIEFSGGFTELNMAIHAVLDKSNYIMGNEVKDLEENLQKFTGAKHVITCSSGGGRKIYKSFKRKRFSFAFCR